MRRFLWLSVAAFFVVAALVDPTDRKPGPSSVTSATQPGPNVLVIITDDQREQGTMAMMQETLAWFGERGTRFTEAYASVPLCCPFRASMFTGMYAHNHGVRRNPEARNLDDTRTIQAYLDGLGYQTGLVGKYLNNWPIEEAPPHFDRYLTFKTGTGNRESVYREPEINDQGNVYRANRYLTDILAEGAIETVRTFEEDDDTPWIMFVAPFAPHLPFDPGPRYSKAKVPAFDRNPAYQEIDRTDKPPYVRDAPPVPDSSINWMRKHQLRTLLAVDDLVADLRGTLDELGETQDTLAFFTSDGGYLWGEHGLKRKKVPYTDSISIPLFASWPGHIEAGATDDRLVGPQDIAPTIVDAVGLELDLPAPFDGRSLLGDFEREFTLSEHWPGRVTTIPHWASLRAHGYHYIEQYDDDGNVTFVEFYDLKKDPWQLTNLLGDTHKGNDPSAAMLERLSEELGQARSCSGPTCP